MRPKHIPEDLPRFFAVSEAARLLQVQEPRIRRAILEGDLPAARIGRIYRIREEDLFAYFERNLVHRRSGGEVVA